MELAAMHLILLCVEMCSYGSHSSWIANYYNLVSKIFWFYVKVEYASVFVYDKFRFCKTFLFHDNYIFIIVVG